MSTKLIFHPKIGEMKRTFDIKNIRNQRDAKRLEHSLSQINGVKHAAAISPQSVNIIWDESKLTSMKLIQEINALGWTVLNLNPDKLPNKVKGHIKETNFELVFSIISGFFLLFGFVYSKFENSSESISIFAYFLSGFFSGFFTVKTAFQDMKKGKVEIDFLMLFAAVGAASLGRWSEGALLLLLFNIGHALENYAMSRARKSISALSELSPETAIVKRQGEQIEVPIEVLCPGDILIVKPNSKISADGIVIKGESSVNQAPITGESIPVYKFPLSNTSEKTASARSSSSHRVFSGTINGSGALEIEVLKKAEDSTLSRLISMVKEAETQKSKTQHLAEKFEKVYVPIVLVFVVLLMFAFLIIEESFQHSFYRAMSVLIAASPCALAISTPSAVLAGIARAAKMGVLVKGGKPLEKLGKIKAIAFDKTGTLTTGKPILTNIIPYGSISEEELLQIAIAVEKLSDHPLAGAIVKGGLSRLKNEINLEPAIGLEAITARGVRAHWKENEIHIGNRRLCQEITGAKVPEEMDQKMSQLESTGHTAMIILKDADCVGLISTMDVSRPEAKSTFKNLKKIGLEKMVMLSGDNQKVVDSIAKEIGLSDAMGDLLPEEKVAVIKQLTDEFNYVAMVGDGVNDAPAMASSTVGIAMGAAGSDVALETAEVALMSDKLNNLPFAIALGQQTNKTILQNLIISMGMVALLIPLTLFGSIAIGPAIVGHEGSTVLVVLNALRLLNFKLEKYS